MENNFYLRIVNYIYRQRKIFLGLLLILLAVFPFIIDNQYLLHITITMLLSMLLASGLNIIVGYTGQYIIGYIAFYAIGAYTAAIISTSYEINFIIVLLISGVLASLFSLLLGLPTLRLQGIFFAFATLGFTEVVRLTILNWKSLTRGPFGIPGIPLPRLFDYTLNNNIHFYFFILILLILKLIISRRLINSRLGRAWLSIKEDENAARSMGVDTFKYKLINLMYGTFWAGVSGGFFAYFTSYVSADSFVLDESFKLFAMMLVGGVGTLLGPLVGGGILSLLPQLVRGFAGYQMIFYGLAILVIMHYKPSGLLGDINVTIQNFDNKADD